MTLSSLDNLPFPLENPTLDFDIPDFNSSSRVIWIHSLILIFISTLFLGFYLLSLITPC